MKLSRQLALFYIRAKFNFLSAISKKVAARQAFELFCTPPTRDVLGFPEIFSEAEQLGFTFGSYAIAGYRWNKGGAKKVLILHGFESAAINFAGYVKPFLEKNYEVLAFDAPAHGRSSGKKINGLIYRDFVKYICEQYGPIHSYIGHSFGGFAVCLALAELPHNENYRIALVAPAAETSTAIDNLFSLLHLDSKVRKEFENIIYSISGHPVSWFSIGRAMENIQAKIIWLHDENDKTTPLRDAIRVKENWPGIEFVITKGLGHSRIYRDEKVIAAIAAFL